MHLSILKDRTLDMRDTVTIFIDPDKIVPRPASEDSSGANVLQGRVVQMIEENGKVRIVVDAGVWVALLISKNRYQKIGFMVGETIKLSIPPEAIHLI
jgi:ABC-type molybdate transport system ATPase subunit